MEIQQIISHIVRNVRNTYNAFNQKGLPYDPQIIARATFKELRSLDPSVSEKQFNDAIERMHDEGLAVSKANGLIFFDERILDREPAEARM